MRVLRSVVVMGILLWASSLASQGFSLDPFKLTEILTKGLKSFGDVPEEKEIRIGKDLSATLLGATPLVDDPAVQKYVNRIGRWLALQTERPDLPWTFAVIDTDTVNAFAAPGGYVFVTRGLFLMLRSEAELAGVVGHEISHVVRRHHLVAIEKQLRAGLATDVAGMLVDYDSEMVDALVGAGMELYSKGLDRDDEFEADRMGVVVAARSGYDAFGLPAMLLTLYDRNENDQNLSFLFSTHPPTVDRLEQLDGEMQGRMDQYSGAAGQTKRFQEIQKRLRKK
ncbi:MAG: M48 family metallopeptidase [Gammaproteobacteria bacterium]|nr:MAG: M48 family metallopeptidase [Gammaproteobacteria bacterium]